MSAQQVIDASHILYDEFSHLKINDVVLCFNKIKRGHYGTLYDRLDVHVIMEKMRLFEADQTEQIEHFRQRENNELKRLERSLPLFTGETAPNEIALEHIKKIRASLEKPKTQQSKQKIVRTTDADISSWIKKFNKLTDHCNGKRYVFRYGKMHDITEFLNHKQYQKSLLKQRQWKG